LLRTVHGSNHPRLVSPHALSHNVPKREERAHAKIGRRRRGSSRASTSAASGAKKQKDGRRAGQREKLSGNAQSPVSRLHCPRLDQRLIPTSPLPSRPIHRYARCRLMSSKTRPPRAASTAGDRQIVPEWSHLHPGSLKTAQRAEDPLVCRGDSRRGTQQRSHESPRWFCQGPFRQI
jgi:hypothetical protein